MQVGCVYLSIMDFDYFSLVGVFTSVCRPVVLSTIFFVFFVFLLFPTFPYFWFAIRFFFFFFYLYFYAIPLCCVGVVSLTGFFCFDFKVCGFVYETRL